MITVVGENYEYDIVPIISKSHKAINYSVKMRQVNNIKKSYNRSSLTIFQVLTLSINFFFIQKI